jgi:hypothetical protein
LGRNGHPALFFDIGEGRLLFLQGQWLELPFIYGEDAERIAPSEDDTETDAVNGLPPPYAFPNASFVVHRLPSSGDVLAIRLQDGAPLSLEHTRVDVDALAEHFRSRGDNGLWDESKLLVGSLDDLDAVAAA